MSIFVLSFAFCVFCLGCCEFGWQSITLRFISDLTWSCSKRS